MANIKLSHGQPRRCTKIEQRATPATQHPHASRNTQNRKRNKVGVQSPGVHTNAEISANSDTLTWYIGRLLQIDRPAASFGELEPEVHSILAHLRTISENDIINISDVDDTVRRRRAQRHESSIGKSNSHGETVDLRVEYLQSCFNIYLERWRTIGSAYLQTILLFCGLRLARRAKLDVDGTIDISTVRKLILQDDSVDMTALFNKTLILFYGLHKIHTILQDIQILDLREKLRSINAQHRQSSRGQKRLRVLNAAYIHSRYMLRRIKAARRLFWLQDSFHPSVQCQIFLENAQEDMVPSLNTADRSAQYPIERPHRIANHVYGCTQPKKRGNQVKQNLHQTLESKRHQQSRKTNEKSFIRWSQRRYTRHPCRKCPRRKVFSSSIPYVDPASLFNDWLLSFLEDFEALRNGPDPITRLHETVIKETFIGALDISQGSESNAESVLEDLDTYRVGYDGDWFPSEIEDDLVYPFTQHCKSGYSKASKKLLSTSKSARPRMKKKKIIRRDYDLEDYLRDDDHDIPDWEDLKHEFWEIEGVVHEPMIPILRLELGKTWARSSSEHLLPSGILLDKHWILGDFLRHDTHADVYAVHDVKIIDASSSLHCVEAHVFLEVAGKWAMYAKRRVKAMKQKTVGDIVLGEYWMRECHRSFGHSTYSVNRNRSMKASRSDGRSWGNISDTGLMKERHVLIFGQLRMKPR